jgi:hypothetical protein
MTQQLNMSKEQNSNEKQESYGIWAMDAEYGYTADELKTVLPLVHELAEEMNAVENNLLK